MAHVKQPPIITTDQWGAIPAKAHTVYVGRPDKIIFHHTAGHHPEIDHPKDESRAEAIRYAQAIQKFHMFGNGWNDSGHNFLICRNGLILVGRHMSSPRDQERPDGAVGALPGREHQPGIEHEHFGDEPMTKEQFGASAHLVRVDHLDVPDA
jgi:hypothetical protein